MDKFFSIPFALTGTRAAVPNVDPGDNSVNYEEGWTPPYQLPKTDPSSKNIPRNQSNQLMYDLTNEMRLLQSNGVPDFITSMLNGGTPFSYGIGARVRYDDGTNGPRVFISRVAANVDLPTVAASWAPARDFDPAAAATGTANAITATFVPSLGLVPAGTIFYLRHAAANTTGVTLALNGGAAKAVVKSNNLPLIAGDIPGAGSWGQYVYDLTLDKYVLLNASGVIFATSAEVQAGVASGVVVSPASLRAGAVVRLAPTAVGGLPSVTFSGIPSWAQHIALNFTGVVSAAGALIAAQLGDAGGIETTGYTGSVSSITGATATSAAPVDGLHLITVNSNVANHNGRLVFERVDGNTWSMTGVIGRQDLASTSYSACTKTLSQDLDRVALRCASGNFAVGGTVSCQYW